MNTSDSSFSSDQPYHAGYEPHLLPLIRVGFGKRFMAWLTDGVIVGAIVAVLFFVIGEKHLRLFNMLDNDTAELSLSAGDSDDDDGASEEMQEQLEEKLGISFTTLGIVSGMNNIVMLLYSLIELLTAASPAKRILGLRIATDNGLQASRQLLAVRWAAKYGAYMLALVPGLSLLASLWSVGIFVGCFAVLATGKQALHDIIAHSAVFHIHDVIVEK
jgi:uncharacterized RDD family membrane protein YckC